MTWADLPWTLASTSPRRKALLEAVGLQPFILPVRIEEADDGAGAEEIALENARRKAEAALPGVEEGLLLAADTVVVVDDRILGKPAGRGAAAGMLRTLSGRWHRVITAVSLHWVERELHDTFHESSRVHFRELTEAEIARYVESGEPLDKAGGYGIQGAAGGFVDRVEGCYFTIVGLPLARVLDRVNRWLGGGETA